jgi:adenosylmethionine-8-amino-7-oxononanoate aminotransferase
MKAMAEPIKVVSAHDCEIELADGRRLVDGISSWWSVCHGYQHPAIVAAMKVQLENLSHVMFAGTAHEQAYRLSGRLAALTGMDRVFLTDSGSTAVETAMKMAVQYWRNKGDKRRHKFLSFIHGYHGDTMGCMSLCDPSSGMHHALNDYMPKQYAVRIPHDEYSLAEFEALVEGLGSTIAGVIIEPLVQGAGGMKMHSPDMLAEIYRIAQTYNILFIADEVMTGFGRTGHMFACQEAGIVPDIMCVGKGLTGGMMTLAATCVKAHVYEAFLDDEMTKALMSGPTFMANPLACSAANASLDLFETEPRLQQVEAIEAFFFEHLTPLLSYSIVKDIRVKGAIGVVECDMDWDDVMHLRSRFVELGVWLRPFRNVIYIMPPFTITPAQLKLLVDAVEVVLGELSVPSK